MGMWALASCFLKGVGPSQQHFNKLHKMEVLCLRECMGFFTLIRCSNVWACLEFTFRVPYLTVLIQTKVCVCVCV